MAILHRFYCNQWKHLIEMFPMSTHNMFLFKKIIKSFLVSCLVKSCIFWCGLSPFPVSHNFYLPLHYSAYVLEKPYCKQYGPRSDCSLLQTIWTQIRLLPFANNMDPDQTAPFCKQYGPRSDCSLLQTIWTQIRLLPFSNNIDSDQTAAFCK